MSGMWHCCSNAGIHGCVTAIFSYARSSPWHNLLIMLTCSLPFALLLPAAPQAAAQGSRGGQSGGGARVCRRRCAGPDRGGGPGGRHDQGDQGLELSLGWQWVACLNGGGRRCCNAAGACTRMRDAAIKPALARRNLPPAATRLGWGSALTTLCSALLCPVAQDEVIKTSLAHRNIPPHHPEATSAEEAYRADDLVPVGYRLRVHVSVGLQASRTSVAWSCSCRVRGVRPCSSTCTTRASPSHAGPSV